LQFVHHEFIQTALLHLQTSEAIRLYTLQYHFIIFDKFCWLLSFLRAVSMQCDFR